MQSLLTILSLALALLTPLASSAALEVIESRARPLRASKSPKCPANGTLTGQYLSPTLMVPISKKSPNSTYGPTRVPLITPGDFCTIFNLQIPPNAVGKTCALEFLFPLIWQSAAPFAYHGGGHFTFTGYAFGTGATKQTTYNKQPPPGPSPEQPPATLTPGNAYTINIGGCPIETGMPAGIEVSGMLCSNDTTLAFMQSENKCPIGFFVAIT